MSRRDFDPVSEDDVRACSMKTREVVDRIIYTAKGSTVSELLAWSQGLMSLEQDFETRLLNSFLLTLVRDEWLNR